MGKTVDQLNLQEDPIRPTAPVDPRTTAWYRFSQDIEDLLATGHYTWAQDTLTDIQVTVERTQAVSEGQRRAVQNIEAARTRGSSRRYEGWRRR